MTACDLAPMLHEKSPNEDSNAENSLAEFVCMAMVVSDKLL